MSALWINSMPYYDRFTPNKPNYLNNLPLNSGAPTYLNNLPLSTGGPITTQWVNGIPWMSPVVTGNANPQATAAATATKTQTTSTPRQPVPKSSMPTWRPVASGGKGVGVQSASGLHSMAGYLGGGGGSIPSGQRVGSGGLRTGSLRIGGLVLGDLGASKGAGVPNGGRVGAGGLGAVNGGAGSNIANGGRVGAGGLGAVNGGAGSNIPGGGRVGSGGLGAVNGGSGSGIPKGNRVGAGGFNSRSGSSVPYGARVGSAGLRTGGLRLGGRQSGLKSGSGNSGRGLGGGGYSFGGGGSSGGGGGVSSGGLSSGGGLGGGRSVGGSSSSNDDSGNGGWEFREYRKPVTMSVTVLAEEEYDEVTGLKKPPVTKAFKCSVNGLDCTPSRTTSDIEQYRPWLNYVLDGLNGYGGGEIVSDSRETSTEEQFGLDPKCEMVARDGFTSHGPKIATRKVTVTMPNHDYENSDPIRLPVPSAGTTVAIGGYRIIP